MSLPEDQIERLARDLRSAAFPGSRPWVTCFLDVRKRWIAAARLSDSLVTKGVDKVLEQATANAHELGQPVAAKMLREMRRGNGK